MKLQHTVPMLQSNEGCYSQLCYPTRPDNASILSSELMEPLFSFSGIEHPMTVAYKSSINGRAPMAVKSVVMALCHDTKATFLVSRPSPGPLGTD